MSAETTLLYKIAVGLIPGIGCINAKKLIAYTGSVEGIFHQRKSGLLKVPGIGETLADVIIKCDALKKAEEELAFIKQFNIKPLFYLDDDYPERLKQCPDSPLILYTKGDVDFNADKIISVVGTRRATDYGKTVCEKLIADLAGINSNIVIVSGLAYGIDIIAHKAALKNNLKTIAALGHGLKTIYPSTHTKYAKEIAKNGCLVTEFTSDQLADRAFFVRRNRIIAGLSDATIVIESGEEGGALITADLANSYNREVLAIPGRTDDELSKGCNNLIKANKAHLVESAADLEYILGWEKSEEKSKAVQKELFLGISEEEKKILEIIKSNNEIALDFISMEADMPVNKISSMLLNLEFAGLVRSMPGKIYKLS